MSLERRIKIDCFVYVLSSAAQLGHCAANLVSKNPMSAVDVTLKVLGYALFPYSGIVEEFYDYSGEGNLGLNVKDYGVMLGAGGKGSRVVKRICRFKGVREIIPQEIQVLSERITGDEGV